MKNIQFNKFDYVSTRPGLDHSMVNLDKISSSQGFLSKVSKTAIKLLNCCFRSKVSPARLTIFKQFIEHVWKVKQCHGSTHAVNYLKTCHLALQKFIAGAPVSSLKEIAGPGVYPRLAGGLPKFINLSDRKLIRGGNTSIIRFYMTLFSLYRILDCQKLLKLSTITDPFSGDIAYLQQVMLELTPLIKKYFNLRKYLKPADDFTFIESSSNPGVEKTSWVDARNMSETIWNSPLASSFDALRRVTFGPNLNNMYELFATAFPCAKEKLKPLFGYLCTKDEPAGKVRVFAIVDVWTQNVLKPLHLACFDFLKTLPNDGTFDQWSSVHRAVEKAKASSCCFGYDLSAATDRLPVVLQSLFFNLSIEKGLGDHWANLLVGREYKLSSSQYGDHTVKYAVGQPMGALSSWAMLAITHHFLVQLAAKRVYPIRQTWFDGYEVLGDDIVIFDRDVATQYLSIMEGLGVAINLKKSVVSPTGDVVEFAKKTFFKGENVSTLPWKAAVQQTSMLGIASLIHSLHDKIPFAMDMKWINKWCLVRDPKKRNLLYFSLLKVFTSASGPATFYVFDKLREKMGVLSIKNILKQPCNLFIEPLLSIFKGKPLYDAVEFSKSSDMFRLLSSKRVTLLKLKDIETDAEALAKALTFVSFPEVETEFYRSNLSIWNMNQHLDDPVFYIFYIWYHSVKTRLSSFQSQIISKDIPTLEEIFQDGPTADRYFEFLDIISRAEEKAKKQKKKVTTVNLKSFIKFINKTDFKFFRS